MAEKKDKREAKDAEHVLGALHRALIEAKKKQKQQDGRFPQDSYHYVLRDGMSYEEEVLEIFYALVRAGVEPGEAARRAPLELQHIYDMRMELERTEH